jgi:cytoskeleton protein RodZ
VSAPLGTTVAATTVAVPETKAVVTPVTVSPVMVPIVPAASSGAANPSVSANVPLPAKQTIPAAQPAPAAPPGHQLVFTFAGKSWVEVKDATGRVILAQVNAPGSRQVVGGKPPFQVVIGNATQVSLQMDERAIDLVPYIRAEVARLSVE